MKIQKLFLPILILAFIFSGPFAQGQSNSEKEKAQQEKIRELEKKLEKALQMQEAELEKTLKASKQLQDKELQTILENQHMVKQKAMEQYKKAMESAGEDNRKNYETQKNLYGRNFYNNRFKVVGPEWESDVDVIMDAEPFKAYALPNMYFSSGNDRTALSIRKELDDVTFDTKFKYEVTEGSHGINFKVDGTMADGTLLIKLVKPNNEVLQEIEISPLADISWSQDLRWDKEEEIAKNIGSWTIVVSAKNATGNYNVNVRAN